jgi:hypothetical protein
MLGSIPPLATILFNDLYRIPDSCQYPWPSCVSDIHDDESLSVVRLRALSACLVPIPTDQILAEVPGWVGAG